MNAVTLPSNRVVLRDSCSSSSTAYYFLEATSVPGCCIQQDERETGKLVWSAQYSVRIDYDVSTPHPQELPCNAKCALLYCEHDRREEVAHLFFLNAICLDC